MAKVKVVMNRKGMREIMNSPGVQSDLLRRTDIIREQAHRMDGGDYVADVQPGKNRAHAMVKTPYGDIRTARKQVAHNTLIKALEAAPWT